MTVREDYCSSAESTISGSLTHGFHTRESTSTPRNAVAEGCGQLLITS